MHERKVMTMRKNTSVMLIVICLLLTICGCSTETESGSTTDDGERAYSDQDIVIGASLSITGSWAEEGEQALKAVKLFCEQINAEGGVNGRMVKYELLDDKLDSTEAAMAAQRFLENDRIIAVVGSLGSAPTLSTVSIYENAGMPLISPTANNSALAGHRNFIRIVLDADTNGPLLGACAVNNLKAEKTAIIYDNNDYGAAMLETVSEIIRKQGGEIAVAETYESGTDKDFSSQLLKIQREGVDTVVLISNYNEGSLIIRQAGRMGGFEKVKWVGESYMMGNPVLERLSDSPIAENVFIACGYNPYSDMPNHKKFVEAFREAYDGLIPSEAAANTYDAFTVICDAVVNGASKETLVDTIKSMEFTDLVCAEYAVFDENGNRNMSASEIVSIRDGDFYNTGETVDTAGIEKKAEDRKIN